MVTKSGINTTRGTAHLVWKNDDLSARPQRPDGTDPTFDSEQLRSSFTLGGPVMADKLFYFAAVDSWGRSARCGVLSCGMKEGMPCAS